MEGTTDQAEDKVPWIVGVNLREARRPLVISSIGKTNDQSRSSRTSQTKEDEHSASSIALLGLGEALFQEALLQLTIKIKLKEAIIFKIILKLSQRLPVLEYQLPAGLEPFSPLPVVQCRANESLGVACNSFNESMQMGILLSAIGNAHKVERENLWFAGRERLQIRRAKLHRVKGDERVRYPWWLYSSQSTRFICRRSWCERRGVCLQRWKARKGR